MEIFIKVVQLFMSLSLLVAIHEFGHFIVARIFGIRVEKFYIFFDPWFSLFKFKRGDTEYGLGWVPLGGYVKIAGMIDESMDTEQMKQPVQPWEFRAKPAWQRFLVMIAGVVMNLVLAFMIYCGISYTWGSSYLANEDVKWGYNFNTTAEQMGFVDGDRIISIDGKEIDNVNEILNALVLSDNDRTVVVERAGLQQEFTIPYDLLLAMRNNEEFKGLYSPVVPMIVDSVDFEAARTAGILAGDRIKGVNGTITDDATLLKELLAEHKGEEVTLDIERQGGTVQIALPVSEDGRIGIIMATPFELRTRHYTLWESIPAGARLTAKQLTGYWQQLKMIFSPKTEMYKSLGGFISIGSIFPGEWNWFAFWNTTAFLSIILAVMNIIPIPGLDGGHSLFTLWEMITRRKPSDKFLEIALFVGLVILLILLVYATGNDIYRLFIK
ncbi:MAG: RIP metalloprotease RseP [Alistipes sp.]|nr:RIP metalloprotease RseP [Alistipes sp.]